MILLLAGGVGGARLAHGFAKLLSPDDMLVVVNTGDDFTHLGLRICPDLDTVMYTLAGVNNIETGWGLANETWHFMEAVQRLSGETWFRLGDQDLATHIERTRRLDAGQSLSEVTAALCRAFKVHQRIAPMTDQVVQTMIDTDEGPLSFQNYFVRRQCEPLVRKVDFVGAEKAKPSPVFASALADTRLRAIVICPSNPYLSIQPILSLPGITTALANRAVPVVAVSPLIGGRAVKGPAAKIMRELGHVPSAAEIARFYRGLIDGLVIDDQDSSLRPGVEAMGLRVCTTDTLMKSDDEQRHLAAVTYEFAMDIVARRDRQVAL